MSHTDKSHDGGKNPHLYPVKYKSVYGVDDIIGMHQPITFSL